jgi:uncharacterized protein (DUF849 family)
VLQLCPNGARRPGEHPAVPTTPIEVAADVAACLALGIDDVHVRAWGKAHAEATVGACRHLGDWRACLAAPVIVLRGTTRLGG